MHRQQDAAVAAYARHSIAHRWSKQHRVLGTRHGVRFEAIPMLLDWTIPVSYCSRAWQFASKNQFSQPLQTAERVVPDVALGLAKHCCDLVQGIAFDEVETERLLLVFRQGPKHLL